LPRLIGARRAKELMLLGGWLDARQAHDWGLVNRVVATGTVETATLALARELAEKSGAASRTVKLLVDRGLGMALRAGLELEKQQVAAHMRTQDAAAGLRAFRERRRRNEEK
jgi:2-(1,2-epoxy-1,2-dihydrophenyl)acetyl-CoA isomerase